MQPAHKNLPALKPSMQSGAVSTKLQLPKPTAEQLLIGTEALQFLMKGRPDTNAENSKYLAEMVECLAWLSPEELSWLVHPRTGLQTTLKYLPTPADVHTFIRETRARKEQFVPPPTGWRKIADDPNAPWNRETDAERKKRVVREALGYDPDGNGAPSRRTLTPATAEDIGNLRLRTPAAPPSPQLVAKLEAEGYPFVPKRTDAA